MWDTRSYENYNYGPCLRMYFVAPECIELDKKKLLRKNNE